MAFTARTETYVNLASLTTPFDITVTKPTGTVDGDILFCWIGWRYTGTCTIDSVPSGWTLLGSYLVGNDKYALYYKIAASEGASWVWSFTDSCYIRAVCSCYTGGDFDPVAPIDVVSNTAYRTSDVNCIAASMAVSATNSPLVFWAGVFSSTGKTFTKPSIPTTDWIEDDDAGSLVSGFWTEVCSMIWSGSGNTGAMSATISAALTSKHAFAVALNPAGGATTAYKDTATRFKLNARNFKDTATRFKLWARQYTDIPSRFKLAVQDYQDIATRFRVTVRSFTDIPTRFRLWARSFIDTATRFRLWAQSFTDVKTRFVLTCRAYQDIATWFKLHAREYVDTATRFIVRVQGYLDTATRFILTAPTYRDIVARFRLTAQGFVDIATLFGLVVRQYVDIATRFRLIVQPFIDVATRFRLTFPYAYRDTSTRFLLYVPTWKELQIQAELADLQAEVDALPGPHAHFRT